MVAFAGHSGGGNDGRYAAIATIAAVVSAGAAIYSNIQSNDAQNTANEAAARQGAVVQLEGPWVTITNTQGTVTTTFDPSGRSEIPWEVWNNSKSQGRILAITIRNMGLQDAHIQLPSLALRLDDPKTGRYAVLSDAALLRPRCGFADEPTPENCKELLPGGDAELMHVDVPDDYGWLDSGIREQGIIFCVLVGGDNQCVTTGVVLPKQAT